MKKNIQAIVFSMIGIFMFFIQISLPNVKTPEPGDSASLIPIEHLVNYIKYFTGDYIKYYTLIIIVVGAIYPFVNGGYKISKSKKIFSFISLTSLIFAFMYIFSFGPDVLMSDPLVDGGPIVPYFYNALAVNVSLYIPIGAIFLSFILNYGLLEFVGVIVRPIIRPIFKTPGKSAIDAVASFVGSYSLGLLITNRIYIDGKYSKQEAAIIASGFSTVSVTFMIVVSNVSGLGNYWNSFFLSTLVITFLTTAIVIRLRPISMIDQSYYNNQAGEVEINHKASFIELVKIATVEARKVAQNTDPFLKGLKLNIKDGMAMNLIVIPSILAIGTLGILFAHYIPIFDYLGYIFAWPFIPFVGVTEAVQAGGAIALGFVEMFLPSTQVTTASLMTRYVVAVTSISTIIFLSGTVPCILGTKIPVTIADLTLIYIQRAIVTIILAIGSFYLLSAVGIF